MPITVSPVNFDEYARTAVNLANAQVETLDQARAVLASEAAEVTERDVATLRRGAKRLREIFELGAGGRDKEAVEQLKRELFA